MGKNDGIPPREALLKNAENRERLTRVLDKAEQAIRTWEVILTDFLSPPELVEAEAVFKQLTEVHLLAWGGIPKQNGGDWRSPVQKFPLTKANS